MDPQGFKARLSKPVRILIIEDEEAIRTAMRQYFETLGYRVDCAEELEEARELLSSAPYAVAITDLCLTGLFGAEGLGVLSYVRETSLSTRVVVLTAHGSPEVEREAHRLGVDSFLHKPKPLSEIAAVVHRLLEAA